MKFDVKAKFLLPLAALFSLAALPGASAHCPLCTAAVGVGVGVARFYGVSDAVVGLWIGAFVVSTALWLDKALKKKLTRSIPAQGLLLVALGLVATILPFRFAGLFSSSNMFFGINALLLSILIGSGVTYGGLFLADKLKKIYGKVFVPFQSIIIILVLLGLLSLAFQFV